MARLNSNIPVIIVQGDKVVFDPSTAKQQQIPQNNIQRTTERVPWPQQQQYQPPQAKIQREYATVQNNQQMVTITPEEMMALMASYQTMGKELPTTITQPPQIPKNMIPNQQQPQYTTPLNTVGPIKEFEHYYRNGVLYFYWPKAIKNDIIQWLRRIEEAHNSDIALMLAKRLEIEYIPKVDWEVKAMTNKPSTTPQLNNCQVVPQQSNYQTVNPYARKSAVETIIAPPHPAQQLNVERQEFLDQQSYGTSSVVDAVSSQSNVQMERPTTGLFVSKPMTAEEIEAENQKSLDPNAIMGFPGIPAIDTAKFKEYIPRIANMVKQKFDNFPLSSDGERQCLQLSYDIAHFIEDDVKNLMKDDGKGLVVKVTRSVDHMNRDCFIVDVSNYNSPLFQVILMPAQPQLETTPNNPPLQPKTIIMEENDDEKIKTIEELLGISEEQLVKFFENNVRKFDPSSFSDVENTKKALAAFLCSALKTRFSDKITVPRAYKEVLAYINSAINFNDMKAKQQPQQVNTNRNTVAGAL